MTTIYNWGEKISYTKGDTFELEVYSENFEEGDTCLFVIAENENSEELVNSAFMLENGSFSVVLSLGERNKLEIGMYIYKIVITSVDGSIITTKSGNFEVRWGA